MKKAVIQKFQLGRSKLLKFIFIVICVLGIGNANACTNITLHYKNQYVVGQNFDWPNKYAYIAINPTGNSAVMEELNGELKIYQGKDLPVPVLTNDRYQASIQSLKQYKNFGGDLPLPGGHYSQTRFVLAATFLKKLSPITSHQQAIANTFDALGYLSQPPGTPWQTSWSVVYDLSNKILYYRDVDNQQIRFVRLNDFNFSNKQPTKILLMNNNFSGNVAKDFQVIFS